MNTSNTAMSEEMNTETSEELKDVKDIVLFHLTKYGSDIRSKLVKKIVFNLKIRMEEVQKAIDSLFDENQVILIEHEHEEFGVDQTICLPSTKITYKENRRK